MPEAGLLNIANGEAAVMVGAGEAGTCSGKFAIPPGGDLAGAGVAGGLTSVTGVGAGTCSG